MKKGLYIAFGALILLGVVFGGLALMVLAPVDLSAPFIIGAWFGATFAALSLLWAFGLKDV